MSEEKLKDLVYLAWRMSQLDPPHASPDHAALTHENVKILFSSVGFGDINRFRPVDSEKFYEKTKLSELMMVHIVYLVRDMQNACKVQPRSRGQIMLWGDRF